MPESEKDLDRVLHATLFGDALIQAEVAALLADDDGRYVAVNDEACDLTGYSRSRLTSLRIGKLAGDERSRRIYENLARGKLRGRKVVRRRDGDLVQCRYWCLRTTVGEHLPYFVMLLWPDPRNQIERARRLRDDAEALTRQAQHQVKRAKRNLGQS
jgi:PAS domain S-box-containing protein